MRTSTRKSLVRRHQRALERARVLYQQADEYFSRLLAGTPVGTRIEIENLGTFTLVDNFATTNVSFRTAKVARSRLACGGVNHFDD